MLQKGNLQQVSPLVVTERAGDSIYWDKVLYLIGFKVWESLFFLLKMSATSNSK